MLISPLLELALAFAAIPAQAEPQAQGSEHHGAHTMPMAMTGALGSYPMSRDASGTAPGSRTVRRT